MKQPEKTWFWNLLRDIAHNSYENTGKLLSEGQGWEQKHRNWQKLNVGKGNCQAAKEDQGREGRMKTLPEMAIITGKLHLDQADAIFTWMYWISV